MAARKSTRRNKRLIGKPKDAAKKFPQLTEAQESLLGRLNADRAFQVVTDHHKTQQALVDRELATKDATGKKIKATARGRKLASQLSL